MAIVQRDLGPRSPWGRFRIAVERFDALLGDVLARRRAEDDDRSVLAMLLKQRDAEGNQPSDQHVRDQLVALLVGGHDSSAASLSWAFERLAPASRCPGPAARGRSGLPRRRRQGGAAGPSGVDDRATSAARAGEDRRAGRSRRECNSRPACGCRFAARTCGRMPRRSGPSAGSPSRRRIRRRGSRSAAGFGAARARRSPRWRCARCCASPRSCGFVRLGGERAGAAQHARGGAGSRRRGDRRMTSAGVRREAMASRAWRRIEPLALYPRPLDTTRVRIVTVPWLFGCRGFAGSTATRSGARSCCATAHWKSTTTCSRTKWSTSGRGSTSGCGCGSPTSKPVDVLGRPLGLPRESVRARGGVGGGADEAGWLMSSARFQSGTAYATPAAVGG